MSTTLLFLMLLVGLIGLFKWLIEWANSLDTDLDYPYTEYPDEEDE